MQKWRRRVLHSVHHNDATRRRASVPFGGNTRAVHVERPAHLLAILASRERTGRLTSDRLRL